MNAHQIDFLKAVYKKVSAQTEVACVWHLLFPTDDYTMKQLVRMGYLALSDVQDNVYLTVAGKSALGGRL